MAAQQVFVVVELIEQILLLLPEQDIVVPTRINRTTRDTIAQSPPLQRKLFLLPDESSTEVRFNPIFFRESFRGVLLGLKAALDFPVDVLRSRRVIDSNGKWIPQSCDDMFLTQPPRREVWEAEVVGTKREELEVREGREGEAMMVRDVFGRMSYLGERFCVWVPVVEGWEGFRESDRETWEE